MDYAPYAIFYLDHDHDDPRTSVLIGKFYTLIMMVKRVIKVFNPLKISIYYQIKGEKLTLK
jgi:hypothetical protein